jgi:hypothetical protein
MRGLGFILIVVFMAAFGVQAQADELPLLAAFKSFCVNTGGGPDAVKPAVEMAGGKQFKSASSDSPYPMTVASWSVTIGGHKMMVSTGTSRPPLSAGRVGNTTDCTIVSFANEDTSIAKIQEWVRVPPDSSSDAGSIFYGYQEQREVRSPLPTDKRAMGSLMAAGHIWSLVIRRPTTDFASIQLIHQLGLVCAKACANSPSPPMEERPKTRRGRG